MASYGILGFLQGAGEAGAKAAEEAQRSHNENARLKMAAELEDKRQAQSQQFQTGLVEKQRGYAKEDYVIQRADTVADREATTAAALRQTQLEAAAARQEGETEREHEIRLQRMKEANRAGSYSDISVGINPATGERDQFRLDNRTGEPQWIGVGAPVNPLDDVKLRKETANALVAEGKADTVEQSKKSAESNRATALAMVESLIKRPNDVKNAVGPIDSRWPKLLRSDETNDAALDLQNLTNLLAPENLGLLTGPQTDADLAFIKDIGAGRIAADGSDKRVIDGLNSIRNNLIQSAKDRQAKQGGGSGASGGWGDDSANQSGASKRVQDLVNLYAPD